jgi:hypothetical protein
MLLQTKLEQTRLHNMLVTWGVPFPATDKPVSEHEVAVDPATDVVPLCANCHAVAHRRRDTVTSIERLKELIEKAKG